MLVVFFLSLIVLVAFSALAGRIAEYEIPVVLLENKNSLFAKLVAEYAIRSTK